MSSQVLGDKDANAAMMTEQQQEAPAKDVKSMEYHRQVFQSKMAEEKYALSSRPVTHAPSGKYVSPSDNIMSPCTAKINALRNKHAAKVKPKSLFAQASVKKLTGESSLGARDVKPST
ncbi:hypothetical protein TOPH_01503 [Tolypocladium ophioglossoides CBS 100239]|uniref:Spo12-like protein n=1 Tax=Tolypocladium ophioglossoides (strain CBS 100239) TaxID=1163406 RepID=A0A0L0NIA9_TOLOC|nr:hypothetical protein TOPH_01503 [Tolypocladium ophioglossoides CBS 100239]